MRSPAVWLHLLDLSTTCTGPVVGETPIHASNSYVHVSSQDQYAV